MLQNDPANLKLRWISQYRGAVWGWWFLPSTACWACCVVGSPFSSRIGKFMAAWHMVMPSVASDFAAHTDTIWHNHQSSTCLVSLDSNLSSKGIRDLSYDQFCSKPRGCKDKAPNSLRTVFNNSSYSSHFPLAASEPLKQWQKRNKIDNIQYSTPSAICLNVWIGFYGFIWDLFPNRTAWLRCVLDRSGRTPWCPSVARISWSRDHPIWRSRDPKC